MKPSMDLALLSHLIDITGQIAESRTSADLTAVMCHFNQVLGLDGSVFVSFAREDDSRESYRFINTCPAAWCQEYNANAWFTNDPFLLYGLENSEPALVDDVPLTTRGQRSMVDAARRFGFKSGIVVPAHSPSGRSRMGVLYMVSSDPDHLNASALQKLRLVLRPLAAELLDWWTRSIRAELLAAGELSEQERLMLKMTLRGYGSKAIASHLGMSKTAVDQRLFRITGRFESQSRRDAANMAYQYGLLS